MPNMFQKLAVAVFVFSLFGTGDATELTWTKPTLAANGTATINEHLKENAAPGSLITTLKATDATTYKINHQPTTGMFAVTSGGNLTLKSNVSLDYETTSLYIIKVVASKTGDASSSSTAVLTIVVDDVNDNNPIFAKSEYSKTIQNNTDIGEKIIQVHATDLDKTAAFRELKYSITQGDAGLFSIVAENGTITATKAIAVPNVITYNLTVQVQDKQGGNDVRHGTTKVKICVGCPDSGTEHIRATIFLINLSMYMALQL